MVPVLDFKKTSAPSSIHSLFLSRVPSQEHVSDSSMTTDDRIKRMPAGSPPTAKFSKKGAKIPDEATIVSALECLPLDLIARVAREISTPSGQILKR